MADFTNRTDPPQALQGLTIGPGMAVEMHFAVKLNDGFVVDSTFEGKPASFVVGDRKLLEGFEAVLLGMSAGERMSVQLPPEQAFGPHYPDNVQTLPRKSFASAMIDEHELKEGLLVSFADGNQQELAGVIQSVTDREVVVDFNHPLAGRDLTFEVEILSVTPAMSH